jgi:hypothetical protein
MLTTGVFPAHLKYAQVAPLHKNGSKAEVTAYRPITLLTSFQKSLKKLFSTDCSNMQKVITTCIGTIWF